MSKPNYVYATEMEAKMLAFLEAAVDRINQLEAENTELRIKLGKKSVAKAQHVQIK